MRTGLFKLWGYLLVISLLSAFISSCSSQKPIKIGFVAGLTGANSALGVDGRDGALLAVDTVNSAGGVNGRPIELVIRDDLGTPEGAIAADEDLINNEGMFVIVGHMTSGTMMAAWPQVKDSGVIFLSPTVSTPQLSGLDDNFFRLIAVNSVMAKGLALYAVNDLGLRRVAIFYDTDNAAFTETYREGFTKEFTSNGGTVVMTYDFSSAAGPDFSAALMDLGGLDPDGIFIIASAVDTALIAQQAQLRGLNVKLLTSNWALTSDLIQNGGVAVDGIVAVVSHDESNQSAAYSDFFKSFQRRYNRKPTFAAGYGYEAIMVLAEALKKTDGEELGLREALLETQNFKGVHGDISFDRYGDVQRTIYLITVRNGEFVTDRILSTP